MNRRHVDRKMLLAISFVFVLLISNLSIPCLARQNPQDDDVVRVDSDLVVLNVTVTDASGKFVPGLTKSDFRISEDKVDQSIASFDSEETAFAAAILLDFSGSMEDRLTLARAAAIRFLDGLRDTDVAAVYKFDSKVLKLQDFAPGRDLAPMAFEQHAGGMTVLNDAVLVASKDLSQREERRRAIVLLTDGLDTYSSASANKAVSAVAAANATIYAVDLADPTGGSFGERMIGAAVLKNFATKSGGRYIATPGGEALRESFGSIVEELSNQYTITYHSSNRRYDGKWRNVKISLDHPEFTVRTRAGYFAARK